MRIRFGEEKKTRMMKRYDGQGSDLEYLDKYKTLWTMTPLEEWPHHFIHTLEGIP
jgi:hypothetical protein